MSTEPTPDDLFDPYTRAEDFNNFNRDLCELMNKYRHNITLHMKYMALAKYQAELLNHIEIHFRIRPTEVSGEEDVK